MIYFNLDFQVTFMANIPIYYVYLNMVAFHPKPIIYSWVIMWTEENNHWKPFVYCWLIRLSIQKIFSFYVAIMNAPALIVYTDSMMNVCFGGAVVFLGNDHVVSFQIGFSKKKKKLKETIILKFLIHFLSIIH